MDQLHELLRAIQSRGVAKGNFLGLLHVLIGRRITRADGGLISAGMTWREVTALLKRVHWDKDSVMELGLDLAVLPPRDRERYWYSAIIHARVDSTAAVSAGDRLAVDLKAIGYIVGAAPGKK